MEKISFSLFTDLYELTMMQGYFFENPEQEAVFDMFFRRQPFNGGFTIFAGLGPLLDAITSIKFNQEEIDYLDSLKIFKKEFLDYLANFRFTGDIYAVKEGRVVFPNEPLIRVHGKIIEAQLIEGLILNFINFQSLIATKTARIVIAANGGAVLEFGLRRAQGIDGAVSATRAAYIGGVAGTSNVIAGKIYDIPVSGTMAHSWVMSFKSELEAFEKYAEMYPNKCVLLVDTYDTLKSGIPNAIKVFKKLKEKKPQLMGVRLDSGDLEYLSKKAREMFDKAGLEEVKIFASNELDEWIIDNLVKREAPIDAWGVGTKLITAEGDPSLTGVYKIVAKKNGNDYEPTIKISNNPEKVTNPGVKNILRFYDSDGYAIADLIYLESEEEEVFKKVASHQTIKFNHPSVDYAPFTLEKYHTSEKLLHEVVKNGERTCYTPHLKEIKEFASKELETFDPTYKRLLNPHIYKVSLSNELRTLKTKLINKFSSTS